VLSANDFHAIVSGQQRGFLATTARSLLLAAELPYASVVCLRNRRFDRDADLAQQVSIPVISVGNVTVGGTGKTPLVAWLARWCRQRDKRVTLISRGYKAEAGSRNDEALELERQLDDVPHLQNPDRVEAARAAVEELDAEIIVLDDAFQHRRIHRDLDIVLIDALSPFGYGHLLPRGLLREPLAGLRRADVVALSRADLVDRPARNHIWTEVRKYTRNATCVEIAHQPLSLINWNGQRRTIDEFAGSRLGAFCGIGNPQGFQRTLSACHLDFVAFRAFPDHHSYQHADLEQLAEWSRSEKLAAVLCTGKDQVKLQVDRLDETPVWALEIGIQFLSGEAEMQARLESLLS
jgi:tetraacyldisaccharide 4'-kinase